MTLPRLAKARPLALPLVAERRALIFEELPSRERLRLLDSVSADSCGRCEWRSIAQMHTPQQEHTKRPPIISGLFALKRFAAGTHSLLVWRTAAVCRTRLRDTGRCTGFGCAGAAAGAAVGCSNSAISSTVACPLNVRRTTSHKGRSKQLQRRIIAIGRPLQRLLRQALMEQTPQIAHIFGRLWFESGIFWHQLQVIAAQFERVARCQHACSFEAPTDQSLLVNRSQRMQQAFSHLLCLFR